MPRSLAPLPPLSDWPAGAGYPVRGPGWFGFAWHDPDGEVERVHLHHGLAGYRQPPRFERREGGWHVLRLEAPEVHRIEYALEVFGPSGGPHLVLDHRNPLVVRRPHGMRSVALGSGYAEPLHVGPSPRAAAAVAGPVSLGPMGDGLLWEPEEAEPGEPLPIIVFLDGPDYLRFAGVDQVLRNLVGWGRLPRCRAVFLAAHDRMRRYSASDVHAKHLGQALPDHLAEHRALPADASQRVGVGASLGALALLHAHVTRPGFLGGLLLQSGSYFQPDSDGMEAGFRHFERICSFVSGVLDGRAAAPPVPAWLTCGRAGENLHNNRRMAGALEARGWPVRLVEVPDAHNWIAWRDCLAPGLEWLLAKEQRSKGTKERREDGATA